jgi:hypothetical protein
MDFKKTAALVVVIGVGYLFYTGQLGDFTSGFGDSLSRSAAEVAE